MKTVIITGANGNLGTTVTNKLLDSGYRIIATVANESMLKDMPVHSRLKTVAADLTDEQQMTALVESIIGEYKQVDAALMLAGGFAMGNIETTSQIDFEKQLSVNFFTAYHLSRLLFPYMLHKASGRLVFIGARPAIVAAQGKDLLAYALSKSLLFKLAEMLNETAKGKNVTATVIVPGTLDTPVNRKSMPLANPADWVSTATLADTLEFIISDKGNALRETVLKVYNNS